MRFSWLRLRSQPDAPETLNERDSAAGKTVRVPSRISDRGSLTEEVTEFVYSTTEAADQWDQRVWRDAP